MVRGLLRASCVFAAFSTTFTALRDIEYRVEMRPSESLVLSAMQVVAPHSHHVMASRFDATTHSSGVKVIQWAATEDEAGVDVSVEALDGGARSAVASALQPSSDAERLVHGVTWSDPSAQADGLATNESRGGAGMCYGVDVARRFLERHGLRSLIRSHQVVEDGEPASLLQPRAGRIGEGVRRPLPPAAARLAASRCAENAPIP